MERTPEEQFLRDLTRERFGRPVREWKRPQADRERWIGSFALAQLVHEVVDDGDNAVDTGARGLWTVDQASA